MYLNFLLALLITVSGLYAGEKSVAQQGRQSPTVIDTIMKGIEYEPVINPALRSVKGEFEHLKVEGTEKGEGLYTLQFAAVADFDAAQQKRAEYQRRTGYGIHLVFDAPFYKLRAGQWTKKADAEDKVAELSQYNISALIVKLR
jgi:hypothetical protein